MPTLKYWDAASGTYKVLTGGMSQAAADTRYVQKAGDQMTGTLGVAGSLGVKDTASHKPFVLIGDQSNDVALYAYVDGPGLKTYLGATDYAWTGAQRQMTLMGRVDVVQDPIVPLGVATKQYVDRGAFRATVPNFAVATGTAVRCPAISVVAQDTAFFGVAGGTVTMKQAGYYLLTWSAAFYQTSVGTRNFISILPSDASTYYRAFLSDGEGFITCTALHYAATANTSFQLDAFHQLGSTQNVGGFLNAHYHGP